MAFAIKAKVCDPRAKVRWMQRRRSSANSSSDPLLALCHPGVRFRARTTFGKGGLAATHHTRARAIHY